MKDSHPSREQLAAFDRGLLPSLEQTEIERHVTGCMSCTQALEAIADDPLVALIKCSAVAGAAALSTLHGGDSKPDTPPAKGTAVPQVPGALLAHPRYRIVGLIGSGGMGAVFQAEHRVMERPVALKVINPELVNRPGAAERFRLEIKAASRLSHPNIVTAYDAEQAGDVHFLVMELVEGKSLAEQIVPGRPLPVAAVCSWIRQAACGLAHAHERGMVHRDIKPANLMLCHPQGSPSLGKIKVLDFGLARFASECAAGSLTPSGALVGTPDYVAPEQARDPHRADIRADIYSLGCTLYHLLTATVPHPGDTVLQKLMAHQDRSPRPVGDFRTDVPPDLVHVVERMMAKDPARRFQTPAEVAQALAAFAGDPTERLHASPIRGRRLILVAVVGLLAIVLVGLAIDYWRSEPSRPVSQHGTEPTMLVVARATELETRPETRPKTRPEPHLVMPDNKQARDQAVAWVQANHAFGKDPWFANNITERIDKDLAPGGGVILKLAPGLLTSKKPMLLAIRDGQFHQFELWPDEVKPLGQTGTASLSLKNRGDRRRLPESVRLSDLTILSPVPVPAGERIRGAVRYEKQADGPAYSLRITVYNTALRRTFTKKLEGDVEAAPGSCTFFIPTTDAGGTIAGPLLVYAEVCVDDRSRNTESVVVVSNTAAILTHVEIAAKPGPGK